MTDELPELTVRIWTGTAPQADIDELMDAFRELIRLLGENPDDVLVFKVARPIPPEGTPRGCP